MRRNISRWTIIGVIILIRIHIGQEYQECETSDDCEGTGVCCSDPPCLSFETEFCNSCHCDRLEDATSDCSGFVNETLCVGSLTTTKLYGQSTTPSPIPVSCDCDSYVQDDYPYNYTKSDLSGCLKGDDICSTSCTDNVCKCEKSAICGLGIAIAEGIGTVLIVVIVIAVVCGLCCIIGIIYCVCTGALCCVAMSGGSKNGGGQAQMATSTI
eukprot:438916_1